MNTNLKGTYKLITIKQCIAVFVIKPKYKMYHCNQRDYWQTNRSLFNNSEYILVKDLIEVIIVAKLLVKMVTL